MLCKTTDIKPKAVFSQRITKKKTKPNEEKNQNTELKFLNIDTYRQRISKNITMFTDQMFMSTIIVLSVIHEAKTY